jgi:hypothetical protein
MVQVAFKSVTCFHNLKPYNMKEKDKETVARIVDQVMEDNLILLDFKWIDFEERIKNLIK